MKSREPSSAEFEPKIQDEKKQIALEISKPGIVDEYFASFAEENGKRLVEFQRKYNFDFVKEVPLPEGRYEWSHVNRSPEINDEHDSEKPVTKISGTTS